MRVQAVTPQVLQLLYADLSESGRANGQGGLSARSVKLAHTVLHLALGRAALWRLIPGNPAALKLDLPRQVRREMTTWTAEEARRFLDTTKDDRLSALWVLMLGTGMRRSEALGLRWEAIDFARSRLAVVSTVVVVGNTPCFSEPKTPESRRVVHLDGPVLTALRAQRKRQAAEQISAGPAWRESGLVFTSVVGGMLDPHNVRRTFDLAIAKADLPPIRLHDLRHTFAKLDDREGPDWPVLDLVLSRMDLVLEDWIDTDNPRIQAAAAALFDAIEEDLDLERIPPPPDPEPAGVS